MRAPPRRFLQVLWNPIVDFIGNAGLLYREIPFEITSWWRSVASNRAAGGAEFSQHLVGLALDVYPRDPRTSLPDLAREAERLGIIAVVYPTHVHLQHFEAGWLESVLRA